MAGDTNDAEEALAAQAADERDVRPWERIAGLAEEEA